MRESFEVHSLVGGDVDANLLVLQDSLSFWGGIDPDTAEIIDQQHPDRGQIIRGCCLVLPSLRGSTAARGALLECIAAGCGPAAIILAQHDDSVQIGSLVASFLGYQEVPVAVLVRRQDYRELHSGLQVRLHGNTLSYVSG